MEAAKLIHPGKVSVTELTIAYIEAVGQLEPTLNAFITLAEEQALSTAAALDQELHSVTSIRKWHRRSTRA